MSFGNSQEISILDQLKVNRKSLRKNISNLRQKLSRSQKKVSEYTRLVLDNQKSIQFTKVNLNATSFQYKFECNREIDNPMFYANRVPQYKRRVKSLNFNLGQFQQSYRKNKLLLLQSTSNRNELTTLIDQQQKELTQLKQRIQNIKKEQRIAENFNQALEQKILSSSQENQRSGLSNFFNMCCGARNRR